MLAYLVVSLSHSRFSRWDNPYKNKNISCSPPLGRNNTADKTYKPNNVCNARVLAGRFIKTCPQMRNAHGINYKNIVAQYVVNVKL